MAALCISLDGEGVFEVLHPRFQVFNLPLLLGQQQMFNAVQARINAIKARGHPFNVLFAGHVRVDVRRQGTEGFLRGKGFQVVFGGSSLEGFFQVSKGLRVGVFLLHI